MSRKKHLSDDEKKTISFLYNISSWPVGKIAKAVGRHRMSVNRYKNYELSLTTKIKRVTAKLGECPRCRSSNVIKQGIRKTSDGMKQRFLCKECNHKFVISPSTSGRKKTPKELKPDIDVDLGLDELIELLDEIYTKAKENMWYDLPDSQIKKIIEYNYWNRIKDLQYYRNKHMLKTDKINDVSKRI